MRLGLAPQELRGSMLARAEALPRNWKPRNLLKSSFARGLLSPIESKILSQGTLSVQKNTVFEHRISLKLCDF